MLNRIIKLPKNKSFFLFGPRQVGKSTLIDELFKKKIWSVNLLLNETFFSYSKQPSLFRLEAIEKIEKEAIEIIFVDEVQRLPILLNEVQYLMQNYKIQFILTGSSARKLKRGGANLLGGRAVERKLFPLTYLEMQGIFKLEDVLLFGSLPPIIALNKSDKRDLLSAYVDTYLREEIQAEGIVRNLGGFSRFLDMAASQFGELVSFSAIARDVTLPVRTVQSYYEILEDTLIGFNLKPWRKSARKRLSGHPKFYFFDNGVTNAINQRLTGKLDSQTRGRLFEQFIILETHRILSYLRSEANLYYWRTNNGAEVDLIIEKHGKLEFAIEIKSNQAVSTADLSGMKSFLDEHPKTKSLAVCTCENPFSLGKTNVIPWAQYLNMLKEIL